jgi:hypothetical protein
MLRPRIRISIAVAITIVLGAYLIRGLALRGGDLRPDVPMDAIAIVVLVAGIAAVAWMRGQTKGGANARQEDDGPTQPPAS